MNPACLTVVPMKDPATSKTRLRDALPQPARESLARLLFHRTMDALVQTQKLTGFDLRVVTSSADIRETAESIGVEVIAEDAQGGLSAAVATARDWAERHGYAQICVLPADLATPDPNDFARIIDTGRISGRPVICPAKDLGTNALVLPLPTPFDFAYGPQSAGAHLRAAETLGLNPILMPLDSLRHDIDTADCLARAIRLAPDLPKDLCRV